MGKAFYIETYGCQMNVADSELMSGILAGQGHIAVDNEDDADIILLNTCAIREKAEDRIFGRLGWLKSLKARKPDVLIGVAGCMAENLQTKLAKRTPYVDMVIGPDAYRRLPELVDQAGGCSDPLVDVRLDRRELYDGLSTKRAEKISGFITIMRGCDKFCSFCIVPYVRGRERSVAPDEVIRQAQAMERQGFREVTLLGQTVSSYRIGDTSFAGLLRALHARTGMRIRFTSPYPTDFDDELLQTLAELPRLGHHLHLPLQSGSTAILKAMKRRYTEADFRDLIHRVRQTLPHFALSTDIIVGFPGETDADFEKTLRLCDDVQFDSAYMFKYSERPHTEASRQLADDVPEAEKSKRLSRLIELQDRISRQRITAMVGKTVDVLIERVNQRDPDTLIGRSSCFRPTVIAKEGASAGQFVKVRVERVAGHTLFGTLSARTDHRTSSADNGTEHSVQTITP